ncbi:MAG: hypothetical protein KBC95_04295, partial [Candidatus Peribacteraceae bacterium]|nr:hypothetical protein [Candidatus Peribacteraceae bacterium]
GVKGHEGYFLLREGVITKQNHGGGLGAPAFWRHLLRACKRWQTVCFIQLETIKKDRIVPVFFFETKR